MGNYRQHLTFSTGLGVLYAAIAYALAGVHWVYGSVAALLTSVSGLLPDIDSQSGVEMKTFTGILGVLAAAAVWKGLDRLDPPPAFEYHLWAVVATYLGVRRGISRAAGRFSVHRGMSHSFPTGAVWAALAYLHYPSDDHTLRLMMACAVGLGFLSHLLLDEMFSVDLRGVRVNRAFGTAMKFWAPSPWSTLGVYALLSYLSWQVIQVAPDDPFSLARPAPPTIPYARRLKDLRNLAGKIESRPDVQNGIGRLKELAGQVGNAKAGGQLPAALPGVLPGSVRAAPAAGPGRTPAGPPARTPSSPTEKLPWSGYGSTPPCVRFDPDSRSGRASQSV